MVVISAIVQSLLLWFGTWMMWLRLQSIGINYIKTFRVTIVYFLFFSCIVWWLYHPYLYTFFSSLSLRWFPLYALGCFFLLGIGMYYFAQKILSADLLQKNYKNNIFFATMDYRFLVAKSFDIFFQQLLFLSLVLFLKHLSLSPLEIIFFIGSSFGIIHIPLLLTKYRHIAPYYILGSFVGGFVFSLLILAAPYGFVYAYILHWCFYLSAGIIYNVRCMKTQKNLVNY